NVRSTPAPSTKAASSISFGNDLKNCLNIKINNPAFNPIPVMDDMKNGQYVPSKLMPFPSLNKPMIPNISKLRYVKYVGTIIVCGGTRIVKITSANKIFLPLNLKRANPYPAKAHEIVVSNIVPLDKRKEFNIVWK